MEENDQRPALEQQDANIILANAVKKFEELFATVTMGSPRAISQTGEEYTQVTNDGPVGKEGAAHEVYDFMTDKRVSGYTICPTFRAAISDWYHQAEKLARPLLPYSPTLYWRVKPEIELQHVQIIATNGFFCMPTWLVYSRFLISSKPIIQPTELETPTNG